MSEVQEQMQREMNIQQAEKAVKVSFPYYVLKLASINCLLYRVSRRDVLRSLEQKELSLAPRLPRKLNRFQMSMRLIELSQKPSR